MPNSLSSIVLRQSFSKLKLVAFLLFFPLIINAQTLTGLWIGAVSNDSTTVRKDQSFEIVLTEYKGKVYGYSRNEFIVDDVLYYIVKRVEGTIEGDLCEVTDDEIVACNFPKKPEKGVKVTSIFRRNGTDGEWYLDGTWKTNKTKNYYSITGKVSLAEEKDLTASKIFPHLEELKIAEEVAFYKERKEGTPIVKLVKPERDDMAAYVNPGLSAVTSSAIPLNVPAETAVTQRTQRGSERNVEPENSKTVSVAEQKESEAASLPLSVAASKENSPQEETVPEKKINSTYTPIDNAVVINKETGTKPSASNSVAGTNFTPRRNEERRSDDTQSSKSVVTTEQGVSDVAPSDRSAVARNEQTEQKTAPGQKTEPEPEPAYTDDMNVDLKKLRQQQQQTITASTPPPQKNIPPTEKKEATTVKIEPKKEAPIVVTPIPKVKTSVVERNGAALAVNDRRTEVTQVVNFKSDSLQFALYDNGQIDGDTVSVLMNGQVIMSKQGLKAVATRHTIYLAPGDEEFHIVLYAENLGTLPPNTGLLVVRDGADVYNLRFSSDYQKNTGIVFRRKK